MKNAASPAALPITWLECRQRGWEHIDVLLVTGDAYIDHPSFGIALIGRLLESHGLQVAILPQPRYDSPEDFRQFPAPRLFCGITAGNLDSIVANYTGNGKVRDIDSYSPDGNPWRDGIQGRTNRRRPDRAVLIYSQLARAAFSETLLVLGGIEASLRRFIHYDYKQEKLRASCLTDAKADLLVYGMGEKAILEIADHCAASTSLHGIAGTCRRCTETEIQDRFPDFTGKTSETYLVLPSWEEIGKNRGLFLEAELLLDRHARSCSSKIVLQKQQTHWLVQYPAPPPLGREEFDGLYDLPFSRKPHPSTPNIPAYRMIRDSVTIVRGCSGNCSFCAITRHQGPKVSSRSRKSIVREVEKISKIAGFEGTISDLGGPTANLYGTHCAIGGCKKYDCLYPKVCANLRVAEEDFLRLLREASGVEGVRHVFISSGLRMELLLQTPQLLREIIKKHTPGAMKIAPEHTDSELLTLMHKEPHSLLQTFVSQCRGIAGGLRKEISFVPYIITAHPGCTEQHTRTLVRDMRAL
ncbi:MAG: YgiQ family radical SAM protein, partial [Desulfoprunum sp.]|nr:YgiQ family radical SAM protein [Desulfoprunum sp.]